MKKKNLPKFTRPGSALVIVVLVVLLLTVMGFGLLTISSNGRIFAIRQGSAITARAVADAGINKAIQLIKNEYAKNPATYNSNPGSLCSNSNVTGQGVANGTFTLSSPVSSYSYTVSYDSNNKWYQIDCTGTAGPWQKTEHARVTAKCRFLGIALGNKLTAQNNDTFLGTYPPDPNIALLVKTNSTAVGAIDLSKSIIYGDVAVGNGGDPTKVVTNPSSVTGKSYASVNFVNPPVQAPTGPAGPVPNSKGDCTITQAAPAGQAWQYSTINASGNVTINPNLGNVAIYVSGAMNISNIIVGKGSSLSLYIGQSLSGTNNVVITNNNIDGTNSPDATKVLLFGTTGVTSVENLTFKNNANVYAGIYAPNATVQLKNNGNVYGAVISNNFTLKNNGTFAYDTAFYNLDLIQYGVAPYYIDVLSWWE